MRQPRVRHRSVYDDPDPGRDGYRLLVTRYWPRGVRRSRVDGWMRALGAPVELIRRKKAGRLRREGLRRGYLEALDGAALEEALELARRGSLTVLCTCRDDLCHRTVLAELLNGRLVRRTARKKK